MNYTKHNISNATYIYSFDSTAQFLTVPDSLNTKCDFFNLAGSRWQLSLVDPEKEPGLYTALDDRANTLFLAWLQFRYVGRGV